jgi:hypothetical protein
VLHGCLLHVLQLHGARHAGWRGHALQRWRGGSGSSSSSSSRRRGRPARRPPRA